MKVLNRISVFLLIFAIVFSCVGCSGSNAADGGMGGIGGGRGEGYYGGDAGSAEAPDSGGDVDSGETPDEFDEDYQHVILPSGMITAGAWNDNENYSYWLEQFAQGETMGKFYSYTLPNNSWGFNSLNRVKVSVTSGEEVVAGARVVAKDDAGNTLFSAVTDARGEAYLFPNQYSGTVFVTSGESSASVAFSIENPNIAISLDTHDEKLNVIEIMLLVDVTGSMGDEIDFLKAELRDVINRIAANEANATIKLAMLFYRDTDDLVPFSYYDFTDVTSDEGLSIQQTNLNTKYADGGGDYPEAVDEALLRAVNAQWSTEATTKIIFQILDAPAHYTTHNAEKLVNATKTAAEKGIRICPILCSGAAAETEYTMREAAIYTGGTFVFVTNDSGIGGDHHDPGLPNVTVELLNSLMVRLVSGYHSGDFSPPLYWKVDPNLATNK